MLVPIPLYSATQNLPVYQTEIDSASKTADTDSKVNCLIPQLPTVVQIPPDLSKNRIYSMTASAVSSIPRGLFIPRQILTTEKLAEMDAFLFSLSEYEENFFLDSIKNPNIPPNLFPLFIRSTFRYHSDNYKKIPENINIYQLIERLTSRLEVKLEMKMGISSSINNSKPLEETFPAQSSLSSTPMEADLGSNSSSSSSSISEKPLKRKVLTPGKTLPAQSSSSSIPMAVDAASSSSSSLNSEETYSGHKRIREKSKIDSINIPPPPPRPQKKQKKSKTSG